MQAARLSRWFATLFAACLLLTAQPVSAGPFGIPPQPADPLLAKIAPEKCLWYVSWAGSAVPRAESQNHLEALLAEKDVQQLVKVVEDAIAKAIDEETRRDPKAQAAAQQAMTFFKAMMNRPTAMFVSEVKPGGPNGVAARGGIVMHAGDDTDAVKKALAALYTDTPIKDAFEDVEIDGTTWKKFPGKPPVPPITFGFKGRYLVVGVGEGEAEAILKRATTPAPEWLTKLQESLAVERPSITSYVNLAEIRDLALTFQKDFAEPAKWLGLDKLTSLSTVIGLEGPDTLSKTLVGFDGEPTGLFGLAGDKPLALSDLAMIPADSTFAAAVRMDAKKMMLEILELVGRFDKREQQDIVNELEKAEDDLGFSITDDVLASLGDVWTVYNSPKDGGFLLSGFTATVTVRDKAKLASVLDKLLLAAKAQGALGPVSGRDDGRNRNPFSVRSMEYKGQRILYVITRDRFMPPVFAPALCLTDDHLIVSAFPQHIKTYLDRDASQGGLSQNPAVVAAFKPGAPFKFAYHNTPWIVESFYPLVKIGVATASRELSREGIDLDIATLPALPTIAKHLVPGTITVRRTPAGIAVESRNSIPGDLGIGAAGPLMVGLGLPAVMSARGAARVAVSQNNLRQIAIAMLMYNQSNGTYPPPAIYSKDGKPLLSWRVAILPYVDDSGLYKQFKLDEPWDSEHNQKLAARMPQVFRSPASHAPNGMTTYLVPTGQATAFAGPKGMSDSGIRDGLSNTIMVLEVDDGAAVPWTKPADLEVDTKGWETALFGRRPNANAAYFDGSVRRLNADIHSRILDSQITPNGQEAASPRDASDALKSFEEKDTIKPAEERLAPPPVQEKDDSRIGTAPQAKQAAEQALEEAERTAQEKLDATKEATKER